MAETDVAREPVASYAVPTGLIVAITLALFFIPDPFQFLLPVAALASGYVFRQRHLWVIWFASWSGFVAIFGIMVLLGFEPPKAPEENLPITLASFILSAGLYAIYLAVLVLVPLWLGRFLAIRPRQRRAD